MSTRLNYSSLALDWQPASRHDTRFWLIIGLSLTVMLSIGLIFSSIDVPEKERRAATPIPERVAQFIEQKEKPKPPPPPPPPPPKPKPKPTVERQLEKVDQPLTEAQKKAREKVKDTGLLALGNELADLFDTDDVSAVVGGDVKDSSTAATSASAINTDVLTANAGVGSGGIDSGQFAASIGGGGQLSQRERTAVRQSLLADDTTVAQDKSVMAQRRAGDNIRPEEEITIVFDQNKSRLYSIYNRARRQNPELQGKVVIELTISSAGIVTQARIVSSELNDPSLERSLLARVKQFKFGAKEVEPVTVTFPIEFLPS